MLYCASASWQSLPVEFCRQASSFRWRALLSCTITFCAPVVEMAQSVRQEFPIWVWPGWHCGAAATH